MNLNDALVAFILAATPLVVLWIRAQASIAETKALILENKKHTQENTIAIEANTEDTKIAEQRANEFALKMVDTANERVARLEAKLDEAMKMLNMSMAREQAAIERMAAMTVELNLAKEEIKLLYKRIRELEVHNEAATHDSGSLAS